MERTRPFHPAVTICMLVGALSQIALAQYGGGTGEPNDPYLISTAEHLKSRSVRSSHWDRHFKLMADIDLGGRTFKRAVIAPDMSDESSFQGTPFTGTFDGNGHVIRGLRIIADADCDNHLGLFGQLNGTVHDLGLSNALIQSGSDGSYLGVLAGDCDGTIERCYAEGWVLGDFGVGGLVGATGGDALVVDCYAQVEVSLFEGSSHAGGLVATNGGVIQTSYATGSVDGMTSYHSPGGLLSVSYGPVILSFWDMESSDLSVSYGGFGRTTAQMKTASTFMGFSGDVWELTEGDYPRLAWEGTGGTPLDNEMDRTYAGTGLEEDPFLLADANDLLALACRPDDWQACIELIEDINMASVESYPTIADFNGVLNGNGHAIRNLRIHENTSLLGLVGYMHPGAAIEGVRLEDVSISGYSRLGGLVGYAEGGRIADCAVTGTLDGAFKIGGLAGHLERVPITGCYADVTIVAGDRADIIGGLVGYASGRSQDEECVILDSYAVMNLELGDQAMFCGGLAGSIWGVAIRNCYAVSQFTLGEDPRFIGGLVDSDSTDTIESSFWNSNVSGLTESTVGTRLTTDQMMTAAPFLAAGWDFVGEDENGVEDVWWIDEGRGYPRLWWEADLSF